MIAGIFLIVCGSLHAAPPTDIVRDKTAVSAATWRDFSDGNLDKLQTELEETLETGEALPSGLPKLEHQFRGIRSGGVHRMCNNAWAKLFKKMDDWIAKYPDSDTPKILRMGLLSEQVRHFGGSRSCRCKEGTKPARRERALKLAKQAFEELDSAGCTHPEFFLIGLELMGEEETSLEELEAFFGRSMDRNPGYLGTHFEFLTSVLQKEGREAFVEKSEKIVAKMPPAQAKIIFGRHMWVLYQRSYIGYFKANPELWKKTRESFVALIESVDDPRPAAHTYFQIAHRMDDMVAGKEAWPLTGREVYPPVWSTNGEFLAAQLWVEGLDRPATGGSGEAAGGAGTIYLESAPTSLESLATSPDGRWLAAGGDDGRVRLIALPDERLVWTSELLGAAPQAITELAFSKDSALLAVAASRSDRHYYADEEAAKARILIFETGTTPVKSTEFECSGNTVGGLCFTIRPDGSELLLIGNGDSGVRSSPLAWELSTGELRKLPEDRKDHRHHLRELTVNADGSKLVMNCNRALEVVDLNADKTVPYGQSVDQFVVTIVCHPTDPNLAWSGAPPTRRKPDRNGHLVRWNLETAKPRKMTLSDLTGGILALSISPDGRTLAGGCDDGMTRLWDSETGNQLAIFLKWCGIGPGHGFFTRRAQDLYRE